MNSQYETLAWNNLAAWNEQNVLTLPPFRRYLVNCILQFATKVPIIVSSACMICYMLERSQYVWCYGFSVLYGIPAILSLQLSTMLMIIDSIAPCIIDKSKIKILTTGFSSLICLVMTIYFLVIVILSYSSFECISYATDKGQIYYIHTDGYSKLVHGLFANAVVSLCGWCLSGIVSITHIYMSCQKL